MSIIRTVRVLRIPVVIHAEDRLPAELKRNLCTSFGKTPLQASNLRRQDNQERLRTIAEAIFERMDAMRAVKNDLAGECASFDFPLEKAPVLALDWDLEAPGLHRLARDLYRALGKRAMAAGNSGHPPAAATA